MASFEEQLSALEKVVDRLERGELPLDESVRLFEEGMRLSDACKAQLESAEGRIQVLMDGVKGGMKARDLDVEEDVDEGEDEE
jgi:exodeoxyribonuclease VII small subunit